MPVLNNTLQPQQAPAWTDPYADQRAALAARMQEQPAPMFSPEEAAQRIAQNRREQQLGMLAAMSGDEGLGGVGGMVLKNALANRQPRVSERGTADPLTGKFTYSPDFIAAQRQAQLDKLDSGSAASRAAFEKERREFADRQELARQRAHDMQVLKGMTSAGGGGVGVGGSQAGVGPGGEIIFRDKGGRLVMYDDNGAPQAYTGKLLPKPSGSSGGSEDERKAAGWVSQARTAFANMEAATKEDAGASKPSLSEKGLSMVPLVGRDAAYATMSPARQKFTTAASSLSEAVLRAATGAGVNHDEAVQKVEELTPRWGEDWTVTRMKKQMAEMYISSLEARAGRALSSAVPAPGGGGGGGGNASDPLGMRSR